MPLELIMETEVSSITNIRSIAGHWNTRKPISKICVLKLDHIGDFVMTIPAFLELRTKFPAAEIDLICGSWNVDIARSLGIFHTIYEYNYMKRNPTLDSEEPLSFLDPAVFDKTYDLAIDMRVSPDTRDELRRIRADWFAGIGKAGSANDKSIVLPYKNDSRPLPRAWFVPPDRVNPPPSAPTNKYFSFHKQRDIFISESVMLEPGDFCVHFLYQTFRKLLSIRTKLVLSAFCEGQLLQYKKIKLPLSGDVPAVLDVPVQFPAPLQFGFRLSRGSLHSLKLFGILIQRLETNDKDARLAQTLHIADEAMLLVALVSSKLNQPNYGPLGQNMMHDLKGVG